MDIEWMRERDFDPGPWDRNEHGLWCPNCGEHIAAPWNIDDDYVPPDHCKRCGFPEFGA